MKLKYALLMDIPEGKRAGYYAQIIKALADRAPVFDRDKEMLIFSSAAEREAAHGIMQQYSVPFEEMELLLLPAPVQAAPTLDDFGFTSRMENVYVYAHLALAGQLASMESGRSSEPLLAMEQLREHLLAFGSLEDGASYFVIEEQHRELAERIAAAYGCRVNWLEAS
ncbi:hypothetical protein RAC89_21460 [Paenibacillus sp. GD4]|jgi:hypothetical protein|uniref:hypothetical protein n=1 Tax=Paenibacillus sp. GD4 TaxID=3068890 RepID=UPI002796E008|nr:hypothetical protein [Paenibacillus sp. GD4]MDQ1912966.1 hypothetical protein [Paenibacillus sp. GD4]